MTMIREFLKGVPGGFGASGSRTIRGWLGRVAWGFLLARAGWASGPSRQVTDAAMIRLNLAIAQARQELAA